MIKGMNYPKYVYIGRFDCDECGTQYKNVEFIVDTIAIYCKTCDNKNSLPLRDVRKKIIDGERVLG